MNFIHTKGNNTMYSHRYYNATRPLHGRLQQALENLIDERNAQA